MFIKNEHGGCFIISTKSGQHVFTSIFGLTLVNIMAQQFGQHVAPTCYIGGFNIRGRGGRTLPLFVAQRSFMAILFVEKKFYVF